MDPATHVPTSPVILQDPAELLLAEVSGVDKALQEMNGQMATLAVQQARLELVRSALMDKVIALKQAPTQLELPNVVDFVN